MQRSAMKPEQRKYTYGKPKSDVHVFLLWMSMKSLLRCLCHYVRLLWKYSPLAVLTKRQGRLHYVECYGESMIKPRMKERILDLFLSDKRRRQRLLEWVHSRLVTITVHDFCRSWQDGLALCALLESICPGACPGYRLLLQHNRVKNCRLGLKLANKYLCVPLENIVNCVNVFHEIIGRCPKVQNRMACLIKSQDLLEPEEMAIADRNTEHKIIQYIFMLKWSSENIKDKWSVLHGSLISAKTGLCFAKGSGLRNGIVGSRLKFSIIVSDTIGVFNVLVEVRGPNNVYSGEQLVSLHQAKGMLDKASARSDPVAGHLDALQYLEDSAGNTFVRKKVRRRQEADPNDRIFIDCQCGDEGTFYIVYMPRRAGIHAVSVKWQGHHVDGSPFRVKVYKSSNISSKSLKGTHEKRVIYDSLSFTSVDGGSSDGSTLQGPSSIDESPPLADVISSERSVAAISKSKAYTMGRQLTVTRRRVLRRIITRNGEDIVIEESLSPSISRQSSITDNSDDDIRHQLRQKEDGKPKSPVPRKSQPKHSPVHQSRLTPTKDQSGMNRKSLGTVLEEKYRSVSIDEMNENKPPLNTDAVTHALNEYMRQAHGHNGKDNVHENDVTYQNDGGSDEASLITKTKQQPNGITANIIPDSSGGQESQTDELCNTEDNDGNGQAVTTVIRNSLKRKLLRRTASMHQQTNSTDLVCYNRTPELPFNDNRKRIPKRTTSDGPIYELRKELSSLLIREPSWSSHSECSSDDKDCTLDCKERNIRQYAYICPMSPSIQNLDDDVFDRLSSVAPKSTLRGTQSLPSRLVGSESNPDIGGINDDNAPPDTRQTDTTAYTHQAGDDAYSETSEKPENAREENMKTRQDEIMELGRWEKQGNTIRSGTTQGYEADGRNGLLYSVLDNDTYELPSRHNFLAGDGDYKDSMDIRDLIFEKGDVRNLDGNDDIEEVNIVVDVVDHCDVTNGQEMLLSKIDTENEQRDTIDVFVDTQAENVDDTPMSVIHHITVLEIKLPGFDDTIIPGPTHITEAKIMIEPTTYYHSRRNLIRQECRDKGSRESSSIDSDKQLPNSENVEPLDKRSEHKFSQQNIFRRISEASHAGTMRQYTSEVHIVIPKAKVDKSTQVAAKEILEATGWDLIEIMYSFITRLNIGLSEPPINAKQDADTLGTEAASDNDTEYILPRRIAVPEILLNNTFDSEKNGMTVTTDTDTYDATHIVHIDHVKDWFERNEFKMNTDCLSGNRQRILPHLVIEDANDDINNNENVTITTTGTAPCTTSQHNDHMICAGNNMYHVMQCHIPHGSTGALSQGYGHTGKENDDTVRPVHHLQQHLHAESNMDDLMQCYAPHGKKSAVLNEYPDTDRHAGDAVRRAHLQPRQLTAESNDSGCFDNSPRHGRLSWPLVMTDNGHIRLFRRPYRWQIALDRKLVTSSLESMDEEDDTDYELSSFEHSGSRDRITKRRHRFQYRDDSFSLSDSELDIRSRTRTRRRLVRRSRQISRNPLSVSTSDGRETYTDTHSHDTTTDTGNTAGRSNEAGNIHYQLSKMNTNTSTGHQAQIKCITPHKCLSMSDIMLTKKSKSHAYSSARGDVLSNELSVTEAMSHSSDGHDNDTEVQRVNEPGDIYRSVSSISVDSDYSGFGLSKPMRMELLSEIAEFKSVYDSQESELISTHSGVFNTLPVDARTNMTSIQDSNNISGDYGQFESEETNSLVYSGTEKRLSWADVDTFDYYSAVELEDDSSVTVGSDIYPSEPQTGSTNGSNVYVNGFDNWHEEHSQSVDMFTSFDQVCADVEQDCSDVASDGSGRADNDVFIDGGVTIAGSGLTCGQVGIKNCFQIWLEHPAIGSPTVTIIGPRPQTVRETSVLYTGDNLYEVLYEVTRPGLYQVYVKLQEENVANSPYMCEITY